MIRRDARVVAIISISTQRRLVDHHWRIISRTTDSIVANQRKPSSAA